MSPQVINKNIVTTLTKLSADNRLVMMEIAQVLLTALTLTSLVKPLMKTNEILELPVTFEGSYTIY